MRAWVFVTFVLLSGSPQSLFGADATPFKLGNQGGILVSVVLDGAGPYVWLLDTGASHSSISEELAHTLRAPPVARTTVSSPAGDRERIVVRLDRIGIGPFEGGALPTAVPARELVVAGGIQGVLGQDVLAGLRYTIDYRNRRIVWDESRALDGSGSIAVLPMAFTDGVPVVELSQGRSTLRLIADSGAGGLVLFNRAGRDLPAMTADGGRRTRPARHLPGLRNGEERPHRPVPRRRLHASRRAGSADQLDRLARPQWRRIAAAAHL